MIKVINKSVVDLPVDAIVNAANKDLLWGGGVCGAIFSKANDSRLIEECARYAPIKIGEAIITNAYNLKAKKIIHAVGPIYSGDKSDEVLLKSAYINSLDLCKNNNLHSIAFPCISTGIYGFPLKRASEIAVNSVKEWLNKNNDYDIEIIFACYKDIEYQIYEALV